MGKERMLARVLRASLRHRASRLAVAMLSVLLGTSLVAALGSLSLDVGDKAGRELRAYGANLVLTPRAATAQAGVGGMEFGVVEEQRYLAAADLGRLRAGTLAGEVLGYAPYLYGLVEADGRRLILAGSDFAAVRAVSPWWQVTGAWADGQTAAGAGEGVPAMVGVKVAERLGLAPGSQLSMAGTAGTTRLAIVGTVETGAAEDSQVFVALPEAQSLLGRPGQVSLVQVSAVANRRPLQAIAASLEDAVGGSRARVVGQVAEAEAAVLDKVRLLVGLVAALVLLAAGLAVASTAATTVLERTREIGLMKAIGAQDRHVAVIFLAEAGSIGLAGGLAGYVLGLGLAVVIGRVVFGSPIAPSLAALPLAVGVGVGVSLLASLVPIRRALAVDPAATLRGE